MHLPFQKRAHSHTFDARLVRYVSAVHVYPCRKWRIPGPHIAGHVLYCSIATRTGCFSHIHSFTQTAKSKSPAIGSKPMVIGCIGFRATLLKMEEEYIKDVCAEIIKHKPDVVITEKGLSDLAMHFLTKAGISAIRRLRKTDNNRISRACGATIVHRAEGTLPDTMLQ